MKIRLKHREYMQESIDYYFNNLEGGREGLVEKYETGNFKKCASNQEPAKTFLF